MATLDKELDELEQSISIAESKVVRTAKMNGADEDTGNDPCDTRIQPMYLYVAAAIIPALIGVALYFLQPKFVQKKVKGKSKLDWAKFLQWVAIPTIALWFVIGAMYYYGIFGSVQE